MLLSCSAEIPRQAPTECNRANAGLPTSSPVQDSSEKISWQDLQQGSNLYEELVKIIVADIPEHIEIDSIAEELAKHEKHYYKNSGPLRDCTNPNKNIGEEASSHSVIGEILQENNPKFLPLLKALLLDSCPDALYYKPLLKDHIARDIENLNTWLRPIRKDETIKNYLVNRLALLKANSTDSLKNLHKASS